MVNFRRGCRGLRQEGDADVLRKVLVVIVDFEEPGSAT